jgi:hypothetical protein
MRLQQLSSQLNLLILLATLLKPHQKVRSDSNSLLTTATGSRVDKAALESKLS